MRGILKRASGAYHPEAEPQKTALETQGRTWHHTLLSPTGGSSASGAQPIVATDTDQNAGTSDATRGGDGIFSGRDTSKQQGPHWQLCRDRERQRRRRQSRTPEPVGARQQKENLDKENPVEPGTTNQALLNGMSREP